MLFTPLSKSRHAQQLLSGIRDGGAAGLTHAAAGTPTTRTPA